MVEAACRHRRISVDRRRVRAATAATHADADATDGHAHTRAAYAYTAAYPCTLKRPGEAGHELR